MLAIREMYATDIGPAFYEALGALSPAPELDQREAGAVFRRRIKDGILTFVALDAGAVVGTASLFIEQKFTRRGGKVAHIEDVAVRPDRHGIGIGRQLVTRLIDEAKRIGCYKVILDCGTNVEKFYRKFGFVHHEVAMRLDLKR